MRIERAWLSRSFAAIVLSGFASAGVVQAQVTDTGTIGEVTVTARKVEENLQETPISITAFSGDALEERQVFSTNRLDEVVPNLQFANNAPLAGNNNSSQVFIRGIGQTDPTSTVDPGVGLYIDDVYMGTAVGGTMTLRDIASVQVLRGPQGTLFGRNTIGGAIIMTTKDPGDEFGGDLRAGFGDDSLLDGFLALDVPFSETFKSRFSIGVRQQDGYVTRTDGTDLGDTNTYTALAKFVWTPSDAFTGRFLMDYTTADENGSPLVFQSYTETAAFGRVAGLDAGCPGLTDGAVPPPGMADQPIPLFDAGGNPVVLDSCPNDWQNRGPYANNGTAPLTSQLDNYGASLNLVFGLSDAMDLKSISSYRGISWEGNRDADNTPLPILHTFYDVDGWQWSQEFQLLYQANALTGVFGLYYFEQYSDDIVTITLNPPAPPAGPNLDSDNNEVDNTSWAAFTQWTYRFNEALGVTLGGRYTEDEKGSFPDQFDYSNPTNKQPAAQWYRSTYTKFTPSGSIDYRFSDQAMVYASYAEGFKGGGWNSHFNFPAPTAAFLAEVQEFQPEEAQTIEVGFKLDLAGNTLRLNAAVFTTDYDDLQVTYRGPLPGGVAPFLINAGKAGVDGGELEMTWVPTANWIIEASVGYLDSEIESLEVSPLAAPPASLQPGNVLPFAPEWQAHLGIGVDINAGNFVITPRVDASYQDTTYFDAGNTPQIAQLDSVEIVNASVRLGPDQGSWYLTLGVNNATDEEYPIGGNSSLDTGSGYAEIAYSRPREYFAIFNYDF